MLGVASKQMLFWGGKRMQALKERNRGQWHWMETKKVPLASLNRNLWRSAESSSNYYLLLFLSGAIATGNRHLWSAVKQQRYRYRCHDCGPFDGAD